MRELLASRSLPNSDGLLRESGQISLNSRSRRRERGCALEGGGGRKPDPVLFRSAHQKPTPCHNIPYENFHMRIHCTGTDGQGPGAKFFFPRQFRTPSTNSFAYSQSELHDMNMNDLRLRNKSTHARGLVASALHLRS